MASVFISVDPDLIARKRLGEIAKKIDRGFKTELRQVAKIMEANIKNHFDKERGPGSVRWADRVPDKYGNRGSWDILNKTGTGKSASTDKAIVSVKSTELIIRIAPISQRKQKGKPPKKTADKYMPFHNTGTKRMVARRFNYADKQAIDDSKILIRRGIFTNA